MRFPPAARLSELPPYLFAQLDKLKQERLAAGGDVIDLGIGDPDLPTPEPVIDALCAAARDSANHRYPSYIGMAALRESMSRWLKRRFGVDADPREEIITLIGSKEGIAHLPLALMNPGETALVPDPGYPVYYGGVVLAGGKPETIPLEAANAFRPDLSRIDPAKADEARILYLNYPNNPTSATADRAFFAEAVAFAREHRLLVCNDASYCEIYLDDTPPPSILEIEGASELAVEFHSLSKPFNMTGWRVGFAVGSAQVIQALGSLKTNVDSGQFQAVQCAAVHALDAGDDHVRRMREIYRKRWDILAGGLDGTGLEIFPGGATFYCWVKVPGGRKSIDFSGYLLEKADVVVTPGSGFGAAGEGYFRMTLTVPEGRLAEAAERIGKVL